MYEFAPKLKKNRERIVMSVCLLLSALSYGVSEFLPYPALYQLFAVILLTVAILVTVRYLLRDYVYCVREDENGEADELTVVEIMGKKQTVTCRVSLRDVGRILPRSVFVQSKMQRKNTVYRYVSEMFPKDGYFVEILNQDQEFFIELCADDMLIELMQSCKKQDLSDI